MMIDNKLKLLMSAEYDIARQEFLAGYRTKLIDDLEFQINILDQAHAMNTESLLKRDRPFLGWSEPHTDSLTILKDLLNYLVANVDWDPHYYFEQINKIPTT